MASATAGGSARVGGWRRSCRRLLPALLSLAVLVPQTASAATSADAWISAQGLHQRQASAIGLAARGFSENGGDLDELKRLRSMVAAAVNALDALEVHDCFRVWWSYVRSSYVMFDVALLNVQTGDAGRAQSATAASMVLASLADASAVDCRSAKGRLQSRMGTGHGPGQPTATAPLLSPLTLAS